jgi:type IV pilus assembly protein PilQ
MKGWNRGAFGLGLALLLAGAPASLTLAVPPAHAGERLPEPNAIRRISVQREGDRTIVVVHGSANPGFTAYRLDHPSRLVVDVTNGRLALPAEERQLLPDTWAVSQVALHERAGAETLTAQVLISLKRGCSYKVRAQGHDLIITILPDEAPPRPQEEVAVPAEARKAPREGASEAVLRKEAQDAQARVAAAQAALQQAEAARQQAERARLQEEARLRDVQAARRQAETRLEEQAALLRAQNEAIARAEQQRSSSRRLSAAERASEEQALRQLHEERERTEREVATLTQAQAERAQTEQALRERIAQEGARLGSTQREVGAAQEQAQRARAQAALAQRALQQSEAARQEIEQARKQEEARLRDVQAARQQAEARLAEQAALLQAKQAEAERLRQQAERSRRDEEARLQSLRVARQQAEADLRVLESRKAQAAAPVTTAPAPAPKPVVAMTPAPAPKPVVAMTPAPAPKPVVAMTPAPAPKPTAETRSVTATQPAAPVVEEELPAGFAPAPSYARQAVTLRPYERVAAFVAAPVTPRRDAPASAPEARTPVEPAPAAAAELPPGALVPVRDVRFEDDGQSAWVLVLLGGSRVETTVYTDNRTAVLRLHGVALPRELTRTVDASAFRGPVQTISSFPDPRVNRAVRLVVSLREPVSPTLHRKGAQIIWEFPRAAVSVRTAAPVRVAGFSTVTLPMQAAASARAAVTAGRQMRTYQGRRIDLDFKDADIHNILRLLSDVGQVNIITTDDVKGTVTIRMRDVPWDQALDVVLRAKGLGMVKSGNLIRVAPQDRLDKEREADLARAKSTVELQPLETRLIPVSYAEASDMRERVQDVLSPRGKATVDKRTNVLIISDMAANIALAEDLIRNLDTQIPQVLIEARIVEARANFLRDIGIQWGVNYLASPQTGNPTGLSFPSTVGVGGGAVDGNTDTSRNSGLGPNAINPSYVVNLPAAVGSGSGGAIGLALGSIANNLNVNLRLSASENTGNIRVISAPRIVTTDNFEASIEQGVSIPVQVVSASGANTQFVDAKLNLAVKPHVTNDGSVVMDVRVSRNEPDFANPGARGDPSILKREAKTHMLVRDGETAVIGGIYTRNTGQAYQKVPFLGDIPILGWIFKKRRDNDERNELLIFITPRIINRPSQSASPAPAR